MGTAITIGNFDGVHRGHAALIARARDLVGPAGRVLALAFDPHPVSTLAPGCEPGRLTTFSRRADLLREAGADEVIRLEPTPEFLSHSPEQFVETLAAQHAPSVIVEGPDFHFGAERGGSIDTLRALGASRGFDVDVVTPVEVDLDDQTIVTASSTITRWLIGRGRVGDASRVLGRPYELEGTVVQGDRRGRTIGFPTANLQTPCLHPAEGIYAGRAVLPSGRRLPAAIHVGARPTFDAMAPTVEAYILDWVDPRKDDVRDEYGWPLRLEVESWLRDQARFESVESLIEQIERDVERTRELTGATSPSQELATS